MGADTMTTAQAADALGVSTRRIRQLLAAGLLSGQRVGRDWLIDAATVRERQSERSEAA